MREPSELTKLSERSRTILRQIVEQYLTTGEPVGSRNLARVLPMSLSPASIRNVMSDLEQLGLIFAPHTSAGRLPTELGLRMFVDGLLEIGEAREVGHADALALKDREPLLDLVHPRRVRRLKWRCSRPPCAATNSFTLACLWVE